MKPTILFIEDDKDQVLLYRTKFELEGFVFISAGDGETGFAMAREKQPSLIFLDIVLPGENGLEVLKKLKKDKITKPIPTVLLSNVSSYIVREDGKKLGAAAYFVKTDVSLKELVDYARQNAQVPA